MIAAETLVLYPVKQMAQVNGLAAVYLLGVVVVATIWGFWLAAATAAVSALVFDYFYIPPAFDFAPAQTEDWLALGTFLVVALLTSSLADLARSRADEAFQRRREANELAEKQAALRRVATLIARGVDPSDLFKAVADEMAHHLGAELTALWRYAPDGSAALVGTNKDLDTRPPLAANISPEAENLLVMVRDNGRPVRDDIDIATASSAGSGINEIVTYNAVGAPIVVDGRVWGMACVGSARHKPLPADTEERIVDIADLVATAIANAATRDELQASRDQFHELAERQEALRRVATLVARGVDPSELFKAVAEEIARCLSVDIGAIWRYEPDGSVILVSETHTPGSRFMAVGERMTLEGDSASARVLRTGGAARMDSLENAAGSIGAKAREDGVRSAVGVPVIVDGRMWGVAIVASYRFEPLPADTEERIGDFTDLVATALANAATHDELIASRARIVATADGARRRLERDLHDGAQQRLVSLGLQLRVAECSVLPEQHSLRTHLSGVVSGLTALSSELQQISRGIHPAILLMGGLGPALRILAQRCPVPVNLEVAVARLPEPVEVAAYYAVAEALTNAAKYARASEIVVRAEAPGADLYLSIRDDGIGGADTRKGSGLIGLKDRVEVVGGQMQITSLPGSGTTLHISMPVNSQAR